MRPLPEDPAELLDSGARRVDTRDVADVACFIDGVQDLLTLTWRESRPIALLHVAAGAVDVDGRPLSLVEDLRLIAAEADRDFIDGLDLDDIPPVTWLAAIEPPDLERLVAGQQSAVRESLERRLAVHMLDVTDTGMVLVDGHTAGRPSDMRLGGVVKTTRTRYLADESVLWTLPVGWRSPRFKLTGPERYSCYVRLAAAAKGWSGGLIRVEAHDPDLLDPIAAHCLQQRQPAATGDARWDVHLAPVAACERMLRARKPALFTL